MTLSNLFRSFTESFRNISDSPSSDAAILICHCLGISRTELALHPEKEVPTEKIGELERLGKERENGKPGAYLTGERGFYECVFKVTEDVLIPRADTEILVESAISDLQELLPEKKEVRILDLCCGTGCIGISVAKVLACSFGKVFLTLSDLSEKALEVCRENAGNLICETNIAVQCIRGNLFENITGYFDAILSNPPYIRTGVIPSLEKQVRYEPLMALDGGEDGLDFVREIAGQAKKHLVPGGLLEMEIGYDQAHSSSSILRENGYEEISVIRDLGGNDRVVKGTIRH